MQVFVTLDGTFQTQQAPNMDARPDHEEMEQAINNFLQRLEKQEKKGFKDLATILSQLPKPSQGSVCSMSVAEAMEAGFRPICSPCWTVRVAPVPTRSGPQITNQGYPGHASVFGDILC